ncbi:hypothetical protein BWR19_07820 [Halomonas sp. 1513]|nr:AraC family transcriptional regulator [Halomonas sp. 1513]APX92843.1 hypothetical protein BWR19_07820 [Halomonas sp. 1513]
MKDISPDLESAEVWLNDNAPHGASMRRLADYLGYSESHLRRLFTRQFGQSPGRYRDLLRLERAAVLLARTRLPIIEIAIQCGYSSHPIFTRAFHHKHGVSPRTFRLQFEHRNQLALAQLPHSASLVDCQPRIIYDVHHDLYLARHYGELDLEGQQHAWHYYMRHAHFSRQTCLKAQAAWLYHDDPVITPGERIRTDLGMSVSHQRHLPAGRFFRHTRVEIERAVTVRFATAAEIAPLRTFLTLRWLPQHGESIDGNASSVLFDAADRCDGPGSLTIPLLS